MARKLFFALLISLLGVSFSAAPQFATEVVAQKKAGKKVRNEAFRGRRFRSNKKYWRARGLGKSPDLGRSKQKALMQAKSRLASLIRTTIKTVNENYIRETETESGYNFEETFTVMTREVVEQTLSDVRVKNEKSLYQKIKNPKDERRSKGKFTYLNLTYVVLEVSKEKYFEMLDKLLDQKKKEQELKDLEFNRDRYEQIFDEEMGNLESRLDAEAEAEGYGDE